MKFNIYIWGLGKGLEKVLKSINFNQVNVIGLIDKDEKKINQEFNGFKVYSPNQLDNSADYVVIASMLAYSEIRMQLANMNYEDSKIVCYFDINENNINRCESFLNLTLRNCYVMEYYFSKIYSDMYTRLHAKMENIEYEVADKIRNNKYDFPKIRSGEELLFKVKKEKLSVCRFGDGEFEMIFERNRPAFQFPNYLLAVRLREILINSNEDILTCIANNYGSLDAFTDNAANEIRNYLTPNIRKEHMDVLDLKKEYYDAYVSRPYILYRDKRFATKIFKLWKKLWEDRDIVIIEGEYTRNGYRNDLFNNARTIERILCPVENAWDVYNEILSLSLDRVSKDKLVLITLGPTATVLAYDLTLEGYQAIDMGHLDNEYEWYLRNVEEKVNIEYKYVHECGGIGKQVTPINDDTYQNQIIAIIKR